MTVVRTLKVAGLFIALLVVAIACAIALRPTTPAPVAVQFIGLEQSTSGVLVARFRMENQSGRRVARSAYCRINGTIADIASAHLEPGQSEVFDVPLVSHSGVSIQLSGSSNEVQFHGVRQLSVTEDLMDAVREIGKRFGFTWSRLEVDNRWEINAAIPADQLPDRE